MPGLDGTICVTQPLIEPLLGGKSTLEMLALLLGDKAGCPDAGAAFGRSGGWPQAQRQAQWRKLLHDGFLADSSAEAGRSQS